VSVEEQEPELPPVAQNPGKRVAVNPDAALLVKVTLLVWPVGQPFWPFAVIVAVVESPLVAVMTLVLADSVTYGGGVIFSKLATWTVSGTGVVVPLMMVMQSGLALVLEQPVWNPSGVLGEIETAVMLYVAVNKSPVTG
jgi:hypothetical protein